MRLITRAGARRQVNLAVLAPDLVKLLRGCKAEVNPQLAELAREEEERAAKEGPAPERADPEVRDSRAAGV